MGIAPSALDVEGADDIADLGAFAFAPKFLLLVFGCVATADVEDSVNVPEDTAGFFGALPVFQGFWVSVKHAN